jgi:hypothetical protein
LWYVDAEHLRGLSVDRQFKFRRPLDRQIGWLCSLTVGEDRGSTIQI